MKHFDAVVVGAGLSGLCAAIHLQKAGLSTAVFDAASHPGGRVRTDRHHGFRLDRGFQVLLTAYPECRRMLDYKALDLRRFEPGAKVFRNGEWHTVADPARHPMLGLKSLANPIGTLRDKALVLRLMARAKRGSIADVFRRPERPAIEALLSLGFSESIVDGFFRPFLGGIFFGRELSTSSRMMEFVLRMMAEGDTAIPALGMGAIPEQLAARLRPGTLHLETLVREVGELSVTLGDGERVSTRAVIVATDGVMASRLLGREAMPDPGSRGVTCLYFAAGKSPIDGPWLALDGDGAGPVNNVCVPTELSRGLAPAGMHLVSATVIGMHPSDDSGLEDAVRKQLSGWFGSQVRGWEHLRTYRIPHAQPQQLPGMRFGQGRISRPRRRVVVCGDHRESASIHGAMLSGRRAAAMAVRIVGANAPEAVAHA